MIRIETAILIIFLACCDPNSTSDKWLTRSSHWLNHVQNTLNAACLVAQCLDKDGASVLVHGTSGQDSTLIVTSVAQVILNPDCRTVRGKCHFCKTIYLLDSNQGIFCIYFSKNLIIIYSIA